VEFYNRKEIKDVLAYLRVVANPSDEVSLDRIINVPPRGLGDTSVKQIHTWGIGNGLNLWTALTRAGEVPGISTRALNASKQFVAMIDNLRRLAARPQDRPQSSDAPAPPPPNGELTFEQTKGPVQTVMEAVVTRSGYEQMLRKSDKGPDTGESAMANVNELISSAAEFDAEHDGGMLDEYLAQISLVSDVDHLKGAGGAVTLMTLHAAKGLEFPVVAMIGLEEGCLPHARARGNLNELEEERRLCFVGITRAQEHLILTKAAYRTMRGLRERTVTSPFLTEMPQDAIEVIDRTGLNFGESRREHRERLETESERLAGSFRKGQLVRHPTFGMGRIADISDMGQQTRAVVDFNQAGRKTLILQYARLEAVG
jgi:DNA helicase-2/ATP-dependent DNA helicase PcrA